MAQEQVNKQKSKQTTQEDIEELQTPSQEHAEAVSDETTDLLDEIDGVLEENAQEFVSSFVQKGGQ